MMFYIDFSYNYCGNERRSGNTNLWLLLLSSVVELSVKAKQANTYFVLDITRHKKSDLISLTPESVQKNLNLDILKPFEVPVLPLAEQQQIAAIPSSVDQVIEKTESQISKLQDLKKGMMQELLTKGIGHTQFKTASAGKIPKQWEFKDFQYYADAH